MADAPAAAPATPAATAATPQAAAVQASQTPAPGPETTEQPTGEQKPAAKKSLAERRKEAFDKGKAQAKEKAKATEAPAGGEQKPGGAAATAAEQPKEGAKPGEALSDENAKWLRSELMRDPKAFAHLQELLQHKSLPDAFVAMKKLSSSASANRRVAEEKLAEAQRLRAERDEWEKLRKDNPKEFVRRAGVSIRELAELEASDEPEDKKLLRAALDRIDQLEKKLTDRDQSDEQQRDAATEAEAVRDIGAKVAATKELYPNVARFEAKAKRSNPSYDVATNAWNYIKRHHAETGIELDLAEVLGSFEAEAAEFFQDEAPSLPAKKEPEPPARGNGSGTPETPAAPKEAPTSLSSVVSGERGSAGTPAQTQRERRANAWTAVLNARSGRT